VVRCRVCALVGVTATYYLKYGKSSNAWRHYGNIVASSVVDEVQHRRRAAVLARRTRKSGTADSSGDVHGGPLDGYLTASRTRVIAPAQARPHHVRVFLFLVMTLSSLALTENKYLLEFVRGLGVSYDPPGPAGVRNILLDLFSFVTDQLRAQVRRLQGLYRDVPFFHWVTDLWTERHGSGSYSSLVLRCVDPGTFSIVELHLGVAAFIGRHDHGNIRSWTERLLRRYGVRNEDVSTRA